MNIEEKFRQETGKSLYADNSKEIGYSTDYVDWLEKQLRIGGVSVCSCQWKKRTENLLIGLEARHIDKFMNEANTQEYLEYGTAYTQEIKKIINKR